jgi:hypothetical protein
MAKKRPTLAPNIKKALHALERREEVQKLGKDRTKRALSMAYQTNQGELDRIRGAGAHVLPGLQQHFMMRTADNAGIMRRIRQLQ